jgi:hypothetical protein
MAITWRTVDGGRGNFDVAARLMQQAQAGFNTGLGSFQGIMEDQRATQDANRENTIANNEADFKKYLSSLRAQGPQALEDAQASGAIDARMAGYNGLVSPDLDPTAALRENILGARSDVTTDRDYEQGELITRLSPDIERIRSLNIAGKFDEANALENSLESDLAKAGKWADLQEQEQSMRDKITGRSREEWRFGQEQTSASRAEDAYNAEQAAGAYINEILASDGDLYSKRQAVREYLSNPENKVSMGLANTLYTALDTRYGQQNDLTPEEVARVSTIQGTAQEELNRIPSYARIDQQKLSFGDLNKQILDEFEIDNVGWLDMDNRKSSAGREALSEYLGPVVDQAAAQLKDRGIEGDPMRLTLEALRGTSLRDIDSGGGEIDFTKVEERLNKVIDEFAPLSVRQQKELIPAIKGAETLVKQERELRQNVAKQPESNYSMPDFRIPMRQ